MVSRVLLRQPPPKLAASGLSAHCPADAIRRGSRGKGYGNPKTAALDDRRQSTRSCPVIAASFTPSTSQVDADHACKFLRNGDRESFLQLFGSSIRRRSGRPRPFTCATCLHIQTETCERRSDRLSMWNRHHERSACGSPPPAMSARAPCPPRRMNDPGHRDEPHRGKVQLR